MLDFDTSALANARVCRRTFGRLLATTTALALVSCSTPPTNPQTGPRPLTTAEAQRFAVARFNSYNVGARKVQATVTDGTAVLELTGWINTADHYGYALIRPRGSTGFLTTWNETTVNAQDFDGDQPPADAPLDNWQTTELDPKDSFLAAAQVMLLSLSVDRPENPQLIMQSTAQWLRADVLGGSPVDIFSGPTETDAASSLRYWIDESGHLLRLEARLAGEQFSVFTFTDTPGFTF